MVTRGDPDATPCHHYDSTTCVSHEPRHMIVTLRYQVTPSECDALPFLERDDLRAPRASAYDPLLSFLSDAIFMRHTNHLYNSATCVRHEPPPPPPPPPSGGGRWTRPQTLRAQRESRVRAWPLWLRCVAKRCDPFFMLRASSSLHTRTLHNRVRTLVRDAIVCAAREGHRP